MNNCANIGLCSFNPRSGFKLTAFFPFVTIKGIPLLTSALMQIILEVPDILGEKLQQLGDRLPEALDRALRELAPAETISYQDDRQIVELLASQPSPEEILAIRPTPALQARMSQLLDRNKSGTLSGREEVELDRYLLLEHWVRLAKAHAYKRLQTAA
ncbi:hypothetical protein [Microcoleus sp. N9_B4]|uniref:hypothetical protein n=1 Tax=Microcoleus sp. N9_B4 TaxID=3055386 RepID=UPI002FD60541